MWAITFIVLAVASQGALSFNALPMAHRQLANIMLKTSVSMNEHPERNVLCFPIYSQAIAEANERYAVSYNECLDVALNAQNAVESEVANDRSNVYQQGEDVCSSFKGCSKIESSADYFQCYHNAAGTSLTKSLEIQTLAKNTMQYIQLRHQTIEYDKNYCTNKSTDAYIKESTALYTQLEQCLAGGASPPSPTTTTDPSETTTGTLPPPTQAEFH
ncbi:protein TsetseEP [Stomoxys calcitrans]|uniref:protein TsetseEP n=1 Tax=Stomoxys calcitrans TaxID=35570 RepID=UPI0027E38091|nr:protein TsetseEP [Stomoxys calcitrans]